VPLKLFAAERVRLPDDAASFVKLPLPVNPLVVAKVTLLAPKSSVPVKPVEESNLFEISCVLLVPHCRVPVPPKVMAPLPRLLLAKLSVPALIVVVPV